MFGKNKLIEQLYDFTVYQQKLNDKDAEVTRLIIDTLKDLYGRIEALESKIKLLEENNEI